MRKRALSGPRPHSLVLLIMLSWKDFEIIPWGSAKNAHDFGGEIVSKKWPIVNLLTVQHNRKSHNPFSDDAFAEMQNVRHQAVLTSFYIVGGTAYHSSGLLFYLLLPDFYFPHCNVYKSYTCVQIVKSCLTQSQSNPALPTLAGHCYAES